MSIYNLPSGGADGGQPAKKAQPAAKPEAPRPGDSIYGQNEGTPPAANRPSTKQKKKRRWGCGGCLLGCFGVVLVGFAVLGIGGWVAWTQWPNWARTAIVAAVEESDLDAAAQEAVILQIDRLVDGFKSGDITPDQLRLVAEGVGESPLAAIVFAGAAQIRLIEPSGLRDAEKTQAQLTMQRIALAVVEQRIDRDTLDDSLNFISTKDASGTRHLKGQVADDDLRLMLAECRVLADQADIPRMGTDIRVGEEFKRIVDEALDTSWP